MNPPHAKQGCALIADGQEIVRIGLRTILASRGIEVVGECSTAAVCVGMALQFQPQVVLMDVRLPDRSGIEACMEIRRAAPRIRVLLFSNSYHRETALASVFAGAEKYLLKSIDANSLTEIVRSLAIGVADDLPGTPRDMQGLPLEQGLDPSLSRQELRILALVTEGKTNKQIAAVLQLSDKTVKNYLHHVFSKLNIGRRSEAAAIFSRRALQ